uniref:peptide chain release factor N(5)-glutamine methyltransferase n=1 Tax=Gelidibacter sp. TaxID=2018083 RepID=UPI004049AE09
MSLKIKELHNKFHQELDVIYGDNEVQNFFYLLTEFHLKLKRIDITLQPDFELTSEVLEYFLGAISRLKTYEPIQYIIGETEFYGLPFKVNSHTLIPRPETEELVELVINNVKLKSTRPLSILDIGTGTGCIAISLAKHIVNAQVFAVDVSNDALKVAKENAVLNAVNVEFLKADILNWQSESRLQELKFDIIVSNPPYVRHLEKAEMKANVLQHEPHLALFVDDANPLQFYRAITEFASQKLQPNGQLYFEINQYLGDEMLQLLKSFHFKNIELLTDIFGNHRMMKADV